jgi:hypothetical protein
MIVPGGGISLDGERGSFAGPALFPPRACSRACWGRLLLEKLVASHRTRKAQFFGKHTCFADAQASRPIWRPLAGCLAPPITGSGLRRTPTRSRPQLGAQVRCKLSLHLDFAGRPVSSVFSFA